MTAPSTVTAAPAPAPTVAAPSVPELPGVRIGCDVVEVARVAALLARRPAAREVLFTDVERRDAVRDGVAPDAPEALRRLAARFAAKEAVVKLLDRPRLRWTDVEVRTTPSGAPALWLHGAPAPVAVSLSHAGDVAFATVATTATAAELAASGAAAAAAVPAAATAPPPSGHTPTSSPTTSRSH